MKAANSGQAMVELLVALVVMLVLVAGILQIGGMGVSQSQLMAKSRGEAGQKAMLEVASFSAPKWIGACTTGPDGIAFSRDDDTTPGDASLLQKGIARYAHPDDLDQFRPDNPISAIAGSDFPQDVMGLVEGEATTNFPLFPIMRRLIYDHESVPLQGKVWMTWTRGLY